MSPAEAIVFLENASRKMSGLTLAEASHFDRCLITLKQHIQDTKTKVPLDLVPDPRPLA